MVYAIGVFFFLCALTLLEGCRDTCNWFEKLKHGNSNHDLSDNHRINQKMKKKQEDSDGQCEAIRLNGNPQAITKHIMFQNFYLCHATCENDFFL
jgi:hypothetical protein